MVGSSVQVRHPSHSIQGLHMSSGGKPSFRSACSTPSEIRIRKPQVMRIDEHVAQGVKMRGKARRPSQGATRIPEQFDAWTARRRAGDTSAPCASKRLTEQNRGGRSLANTEGFVPNLNTPTANSSDKHFDLRCDLRSYEGVVDSGQCRRAQTPGLTEGTR